MTCEPLNLLVVSPRFVPSDAPDIHRVRMNVAHYLKNGVVPTVLAVRPERAGRLVDRRLAETVPDEVKVVRVGALPESFARPLGISDLALRALVPLARAGDQLIKEEKVDLVFVSTTSFLAMPLARRWLRRFGVPYVIDLQDPWFTAAAEARVLRRSGLKHRAMRALHSRAEAFTLPYASGVIAVSPSYIEGVEAAYPSLIDSPSAVIPFGFSATDFAMARHSGSPWRPFGERRPFLLCAGAIATNMEPCLDAFLSTLRAANVADAPTLASVAVGFLGTGYQKFGNPAVVGNRLMGTALANRVVEAPDRIPLLDVLASQLSADAHLIFGSRESAYQPSKLYQLMAMDKPIVCVAPSSGGLARQVKGMNSIIFLPSERPLARDELVEASRRLASLLAAGREAYIERQEVCESHTASTLAARECAVFAEALAHHRSALLMDAKVNRPKSSARLLRVP